MIRRNSNGGTGKTKDVVIKLSVELFVISGHSVFIVLNHRISFFKYDTFYKNSTERLVQIR